MFDLEDLQTFAAVADAGGITPGAQRLGLSKSIVSRRLARLAEGAQVLVVTHSPQVAALGATHFRVAKQVENDMTTSRVHALDQTERVDEIARMLSGEQITDAARDAARVLIGQD